MVDLETPLFDPDSIVIKGKNPIRVEFGYPLEKGFVFEMKPDTPEGFSRIGLCRAIQAKYHEMYFVHDAFLEAAMKCLKKGYQVYNFEKNQMDNFQKNQRLLTQNQIKGRDLFEGFAS